MIFRSLTSLPFLSSIELSAKRNITKFTTPLISDPFEFKNVMAIRDTNTRFPKPNFISFDAFGTIYTPNPPVHEQYHDVISKYGIQKSSEYIKETFPVIHKKMMKDYPNYGKKAGMANSEEWWYKLIVTLLDLEEGETTYKLCSELIERFKSLDGYYLFPDVIPTFKKLQESDIKIVISSNSDPRVFDILDSFGLLKFVDKEDIYISYDLWTEKPQKAFFDAVVNAEIKKSVGFSLSKEEKTEYLSNCWHIGDGHSKDYLGAVKAGWNGIYLDRSASSDYLSSTIPDPGEESPSCMYKPETHPTSSKPIQFIANNRVILSDLRQLEELFGL